MRYSLIVLFFIAATVAPPAAPAAADAAAGLEAAVSATADKRPRQKRSRPSADRTRAWLGISAGLLSGEVEVPCGAPGGTCKEDGPLGSYGASFTIAGPMALRVRAIRADEDTDRRPYETAALLGLRLGRSSWYGLLGPGRIRHADDSFQGDAHGLAWEILRAEPAAGALGLELSVHGHAGSKVDFIGFAIGLRVGALR